MENGSTEDKVWILFDGLKTPYYTVKESERTLYRIDDKVIGDEDPFFDAIRKLYGGRGIRGYRDAHPEYFINVQNSWIRQASRRYRKYEYVPFSVKKVVGIILTLVMAILLWDGLKVYPVPIIILWAFGCWLGMTGILCIGCTHRFNVDIKILEARIRIGLALGIQKKGRYSGIITVCNRPVPIYNLIFSIMVIILTLMQTLRQGNRSTTNLDTKLKWLQLT